MVGPPERPTCSSAPRVATPAVRGGSRHQHRAVKLRGRTPALEGLSPSQVRDTTHWIAVVTPRSPPSYICARGAGGEPQRGRSAALRRHCRGRTHLWVMGGNCRRGKEPRRATVESPPRAPAPYRRFRAGPRAGGAAGRPEAPGVTQGSRRGRLGPRGPRPCPAAPGCGVRCLPEPLAFN